MKHIRTDIRGEFRTELWVSFPRHNRMRGPSDPIYDVWIGLCMWLSNEIWANLKEVIDDRPTG